MATINPKVTIIAEGASVDAAAVERELTKLPDVKVRSIGSQRGMIGDALKWTLEFVGGSGKLAEGLGKAAANLTAGASLKVQVGATIITVDGASRSKIPELLDKALQAAQAANKL